MAGIGPKPVTKDVTPRSVLLVGLGNVGMGYDLGEATSSKRVLSHARAFALHDSFGLAGGVDPQPTNRKQFEDRYRLPSYESISAAMQALSPQIVVVATPTTTHYQTVVEILAAGRPEAILCEKPLAYDIREAQQLVDKCAANDCKLYVNYFRLAELGVASIQERLRDGRIRNPIKGVCWYSRGMFNSAAHFLNLFQHLLGDPSSVRVLHGGRLWNNVDPEPDFEVTHEHGRIVFLAAQEKYFFHNSFELLTGTGRLRYERGGAQIVWQRAAPDLRFAGYTQLDPEGEAIASDFDRIQWHVTDQLAKSLDGGSAHICSGAAALKTQETLEAIRKQL